MTVPATDRRAGPFAGNGVATSFPFTFKVFAAADVAVTFTATDGVETTLVLDSDYSVTLNPDQDATPGGAVTYPISGDELAAGESLTIVGNLPYDQTLDLPGGGAFNPRSLENALDRMTMQIQQLAENADRTLQLPVSVDGVDITLPTPSADKIIGWNSAATGLVNRDITDVASVIAYGTNTTELFDGDGTTTAFALAADPGSINNLDVSISGVVQSAVKDFTLSGTTLTFTSAPPTGTQNITVRYGQALPVGVVDWADVRNKAIVYASDFGGNTVDDTLEMEGALAAAVGKTLVIPAGWTFTCGPLTIASAMTLRVDGTLKMRDATGVLLTVTAASGFELTGTGDIDLNDTQYIGVKISGSAAPQISGSLTIHNMTGGAASIGNAGALELINCTRPKVRGLRITDILHGTAPNDSQPRAITLDTCTDPDIQATCDAVNSGVVAAGCTGPRLRVDVDGGGVTNDNAFYIITCSDTIIRADIRDWNGEPIVDAGSTDTLVLGGSQINCTGNSNGFEDCDGLTFKGTVFRGTNTAGILKSRVGNTSSTNVRFMDCMLEVSSTQEIVGFVNGAVVDFTMTGTRWIVKHDTGKAFGNRFLRLANTDRFVIDDNIIIFDEVGAAAAADFTIDLDCSEYSSFKRNRLVNRTASGRFRVNGITTNVAVEDLHRQSNIDASRDAAYLLAGAEPRNYWGTAAPVAGSFMAGDKVWNTALTSGAPLGWACVLAGTPGTWEAFYANNEPGIVTPESYGCDPTGAVECAAAMNAAVSAAGGGVLRLAKGGVYRLDSVVAVTAANNGLTIEGNGATFSGVNRGAAASLASVFALTVEGSQGTATAVTSNLAAGDISIPVASVSGLAAGDMVLLYSTGERYPDGVVGTSNYKGELHTLRSVGGSSVTLNSGARFSYLTASGASLRKITPAKNVRVNDLNVVMRGTNYAHCGIRVRYATGVELHGCTTTQTEDCGVIFDHCLGGGMFGGRTDYCRSPDAGTSGVTGVTGYGVLVASASRGVAVERVGSTGCRHSVSGGGTYPPIAAVVRHCEVNGGRESALASEYALDCHEDCIDWVFDSNTVNGSKGSNGCGGIVARGQGTRVVNNTITNSALDGVLFRNYDTAGSSSRGGLASGNVIRGASGSGVAVNGTATTPMYDITVTSNIITDCLGDGVELVGLSGGAITDNEIRVPAAASNACGVRLYGTAASLGNRCTDLVIGGNTIDAPTKHGIEVDYGVNITIEPNIVKASVSSAYSLENCNKLTVTGGSLETSAATASGVDLSICTNAAVSGVVARNSATASSASSGVRIRGASTDVSVVGGVFDDFVYGVFSESPANYITVAGVNARNCTTPVNVSASANTSTAGNL